MYENMTFENIMDRCLSRVSASVDKREGSIVYDAIAPAAAELAIMYIELAYLLDRAFPDTETGDDLTKKCRERSVFRTAATYAVRKGYFEKADGSGCDLEIGTRFSGGDINFVVTERIAAGQYSMTAETAGVVGNEYVGTLFPIDYVPDLAAARLADILIPGEDEESDDALRARYFESLESQAFGGYEIPFGKADIKRKGKDITILTFGAVLYRAIKAADELKEKYGMEAEIIDARTLVPFDYDTVIESVKKTGRIVIVTDACERGSFASEVARQITEMAFDELDAPPVVVASKNWITPAHELEEAFFPQPSWILDAIDAKIVPLKGHVRTTNQTLGNKLKNERKGV